MSSYAVVDSGTTTTRMRLWRDGEVRWEGRRGAGARDTALDGAPHKIRRAVRELLDELRGAAGEHPEAVLCSGMITSNLGLHEVPHLSAPTGPDDLARGIVRREDPHLPGVSLALIPGVKTLPSSTGLDGLEAADVLRGEEVEIVGLRSSLSLSGPATFLHFGSHHKAIDVDENGHILSSRTAMTGELLDAITNHTILKDGIAPLQGLELDAAAVAAGASAARLYGFGRAAFLVRVGSQLGRLGQAAATSYLLGALGALDLPLVDATQAEGPVVLYGHGHFREVVAMLLEEDPRRKRPVEKVDVEFADRAAAAGAVELFELMNQITGRS
jgi:2-dehydro-3-deoxygalactonokinase